MADPMYWQIAEDLRRQIERGELAPRRQLPAELELREKYNASRNTIRDAIKWLITRGLVEIRPGLGTFVVQTIIPFAITLTGDPQIASGGEGTTYAREVSARLRLPQSSPPRVEIHEAGVHLATELQLEVGSTVVSRHQQRFIDDTPWSLQTSFYPMSLAGATRLLQADDITEGTVAYLKNILGISQAGYRDLVAVRAPYETETAFFGLPHDGHISVIETRRTAFDENGSPYRLTSPSIRQTGTVSLST